jgi:excisionase family DNA binding protein
MMTDTLPPGGPRPATPTLAPLLTIPEVANLLRLSVRQVRRMVASGDLPVLRFGRSVRVSGEEVEAMMRSR